MVQNFTHELSAAAGYQTVVLAADIIFGKLFTALFGRIADADAFPGVAVGTKVERISEGGKFFQGIFKGFFVRGGIAAKGRGDKTNRSVWQKAVWIFHSSSFLVWKKMH